MARGDTADLCSKADEVSEASEIGPGETWEDYRGTWDRDVHDDECAPDRGLATPL